MGSLVPDARTTQVTPGPPPDGAVAWLSLPIPIPALTRLEKALRAAYGDGLLMQGTGSGMWLLRPAVTS